MQKCHSGTMPQPGLILSRPIAAPICMNPADGAWLIQQPAALGLHQMQLLSLAFSRILH